MIWEAIVNDPRRYEVLEAIEDAQNESLILLSFGRAASVNFLGIVTRREGPHLSTKRIPPKISMIKLQIATKRSDGKSTVSTVTPCISVPATHLPCLSEA